MIFAMVENNVNMDKFEKNAVIKYLFLKGLSGKANHDDMLVTLGDNAPAYSVMKSWLAKFKCGRNSRGAYEGPVTIFTDPSFEGCFYTI